MQAISTPAASIAASSRFGTTAMSSSIKRAWMRSCSSVLGEAAHGDAETLLARLETAGADVDLAVLGDPLLLPGEYQQAALSEIAGRFGREFAARLDELPVGRWVGPIESGYGLHLVLIHERVAGKAPVFEEVRQAVEREWRTENRKKTAEGFYQGLRERYSIVVEGRP